MLREGRRRVWYGSGCQVVRLQVKWYGKVVVVKSKRYESTICWLQMTRLCWVRKGRWMKKDMDRWKERNNEKKEKVRQFGTEERDEARIFGSWMG